MVRLKHRYLIIQIIPEQYQSSILKINQIDILNTLKERLLELFGDVGFGIWAKSLALKYYNNFHNIFILRCTRDGEINVRLGISCIQSIKQISCICRVLEIAGSTRTCKDKMRDISITLNPYTSIEDTTLPLTSESNATTATATVTNSNDNHTTHTNKQLTNQTVLFIDEIEKLSL